MRQVVVAEADVERGDGLDRQQVAVEGAVAGVTLGFRVWGVRFGLIYGFKSWVQGLGCWV